MSDMWLTADTHFGHERLVVAGWRPGFGSVAEHDEALVTWWNETVRPGDHVWHLGDWAAGPGGYRLDLVRRLHGRIHLVAGNHDPVWPGHQRAHRHQAEWLAAGFASVQAFARRRIARTVLMLSHFPYRGDHAAAERHWPFRLRDGGVPLVHGHVHAEWTERGRQFNAGVDVRGFRPVSIEVVAAWANGLAPAGQAREAS